MAQDLGPLAPIAVAVLAIILIVAMQPASGDVSGISVNWIAVFFVAIGGILAAVQGP